MSIVVGIVGAGKGGTDLLRVLHRMSTIKIAGITDLNEQAPGMVLARKLGVPIYTDLSELLALSQINIFIEATGVEKVSRMIDENKAPHTHMADAAVANLMMELVEKQARMVEAMEAQAHQVSDLSSKIYSAIQEITAGSENLVQVQEGLSGASNTTLLKVEETDQILNFVQNVTKKTKILGFNATIEAARAGEFGKGFGVVAEEVKKLANSSEQFNEQIKQILMDIKQHMQQVYEFQADLGKISYAQQQASQEVAAAMQHLVEETMEYSG